MRLPSRLVLPSQLVLPPLEASVHHPKPLSFSTALPHWLPDMKCPLLAHAQQELGSQPPCGALGFTRGRGAWRMLRAEGDSRHTGMEGRREGGDSHDRRTQRELCFNKSTSYENESLHNTKSKGIPWWSRWLHGLILSLLRAQV